MQYRPFGRTGFRVSALGFGCMRLPMVDGNEGKIEEAEAIRMIRHAIDNGVNYIDTAYMYHSGQSESLVGKALQAGYREKVKLATKLPLWLVKTPEDCERILAEQLERLQTDHIDCYLLHGLSKVTWAKAKELNVLGFLEQAKAEGRIRYIGFSFHDELPVFKEIVDAYPWTFCQIQYNYMDTEVQAGREGLAYAAEKGLAVIVMEPVKGGKLAKNPPRDIEEIWDQFDAKRTPAEWALRWVWNHPKVSLVLSGMSTFEQVEENLRIAGDALPNTFTSKELELVQLVKEKYIAATKVGCTACAYCMPCPSGVDIPRNFSLYNDAFIYNDPRSGAFAYQRFLTEQSRASACSECGQCEEVCPQQLPIREHLKQVHAEFGAKA